MGFFLTGEDGEQHPKHREKFEQMFRSECDQVPEKREGEKKTH